MTRRSMRTDALLACMLALVLPLLSGCGTTSTAALKGTGTGSATSTAAPVSRGPQLGYYWSPSTANVYPILGVTGAAHFGPALLSTSYTSGLVGGSPFSGWALLLDATGTLTAMKLPSLTASVVATRVALDATMVLSPSGSRAAIFSPTTGAVLTLSGLPAATQVSELAAPPGSSLTGIAISDAGTVLGGWSTSGAPGVQVGTLTAAGTSVIATVTRWGGAAFAPTVGAGGSERAVIADAATARFAMISGIGSTAPVVASLNTAGLLQSPAAVAIASDGRFAYAADGAKPQLVRVDLTGSTAPTAIACACQPATLLPLPATAVFAVAAENTGQPAWLLDTRVASTRTFFVPALPVVARAQTSAGASGRMGAQ